MAAVVRAEVAELEDALDSKSSGAKPRAGSIPAFGIRSPLLLTPDCAPKPGTGTTEETTAAYGS
jgi:hypothetical protein